MKNADDDINKLLAQLTAVKQMADKFGPPLPPKGRQTMLRPKRAVDRVTPLVVQLARQHGIGVTTTPVDVIESSLATARRMEPVLKLAESVVEALASYVFRSLSACWSGTTLYYSILARMAQNNPELGAALQPAK